ncbi:MAG: class I SAM-dependent methyltransferase [Chloroflexi bacterium]|nr:class I SAM-dependent methyltransferase [Chloroflexota bacterium]
MLDNTTPHKSSEYDRKVRQTIPFYETIHQQVLDTIRSIQPDVNSWLDTGCGTGYLAELALALFPNTHFILTDPSEEMLQQAKNRLRGASKGRVKYLQPVASQGLTSQIEKASCQTVTAIQCHHYLHPPEREKAIESCYRVLKSEGLFIASENIAPSTSSGIKVGLERWGRFQTEAGRSPSTVASHLKRFNVNYFPITVDEHVKLLKATGFRVVETFWLSHMQAGFYAIK